MRNHGLQGRSRTVGPTWPALIATAAALALAGCSGGGYEAAEPPPASVAQDGEAATQARPESGGEGRDLAGAGRGGGGEADEAGERPLTKATVAPERALVRSAEMTVRAKDVAAAAEKATRIATEAGGYVSEEQSDSSTAAGSSTRITFKVPPDRYATVLKRFGTELGTRESLTQRTEDVTEEVADVKSRIKSAEAAIDQFRALLRRAEKIGEILEIEREISARTAELESLQARQKALASLTGMATITLHLIGPAVEVPEDEDEPEGFLGGLVTGWRALVAATKVGLTVLGVLLPWLLAIGLLVLLVWPLARLLSRTRLVSPRPRPRPRRPRGPSRGTPPEPPGDAPPEASSPVPLSGPEEPEAPPQDPDATPGRPR